MSKEDSYCSETAVLRRLKQPTYFLLLASLLFGLFVSCSDQILSSQTAEDLTLILHPDSLELATGDTARIAATPQTPDGETVASGYQITWSSEDSQIATVNDSGTVVGQSPGATVITASAEPERSNTGIVITGESVVSVETENSEPERGIIEAAVTTTGDKPDSDGYTLLLGGANDTHIDINGSVTFTDVEPGDHEIELTGLQSNCSVEDTNPRELTVTSGDTTSTTFNVNCSQPKGAIEVTAATTGNDQDTVGYTVTIDESTSQPLDPDGTTTFADLTPGEYEITLSGLASNCAVNGDNPRTISVTAGSTAAITFNVSCEEVTGAVEVSVSTSGEDVDSDGYTVSIDGSDSNSLAVNGTVSFAGVTPGEFELELTGIASNCTVDGENPRTISVSAGDTTSASFSVSCSAESGNSPPPSPPPSPSPEVGDLQVTASTSGSDQDSDGYTLTVDGSNGTSVGINGSTTFTDLTTGDHQVEMTGVAEHCTIDGSNPRTVSITAGSTTSITFNVTCDAQTGTLQVSASTSGTDRDSDGYTLTLDGSTSRALDPNATLTFSDLSPGNHTVELSGVASNCSVSESNPRTVSVTAGATTSETIEITCQEITGGLLAMTQTSGEDQDSDGYTIKVSGRGGSSIGINSSMIFAGLSSGEHKVELTGLQSNCRVDGQNPRTLAISGGDTTSTTFNISCETRTGDLDKSVTLWTPFVEWSVSNPSYTGNPYDIIARVTFTHQGTGQTRSTGMFFDENDTWKWRFTGTRTGQWTFSTSSDDPQLDGLTGTVTVEPNSNSQVYGYMTNIGNKWARFRGNSRQTEVFVPQLVMYRGEPSVYGNVSQIENDIQTFLGTHGFNGFQLPSIGGHWFDAQAGTRVTGSMSNPDPATFEALERLITRTHAAGGVVHIWAWGDQQRGWTPTELSGGVNGPEDRRLQRYIAARLGPLPGWSIGYGFDLNEWAPATMVGEWRNYVQEHMGWHHFVGGRPEGPNSGTNHAHYVSWNEALDYSSYEHHQPSYEVYVAALEAVPGQPVMSEDRFRIRPGGYPDKDYTMELVRRGLWRSTMAGGVANIWGHLHNSPAGGGSGPFPRPEWIATYNRFFEKNDRFRADMSRAADLSSNSNTRVLKSANNSRYVIYRENTSTVHIDLSNMSTARRAVAVDTREPYKEIDLGQIPANKQTIELPRTSDWAIAIGSF